MPKKQQLILSSLAVTLLGIFIGLPYYRDAQLARATAILQIHHHPLTDTGSIRTGPGSSPADHFEQILSPENLSLAIKSLRFGIPANDEEINSLKSQLEVSPKRGTDFIQITARHQSPEQATRIANSVAEAYLIRLVEIERERASAKLEAYDREIIAQLELTHDHWLKFLSVCKQLGFEGPFFKDDPPKLPDVKFVSIKSDQQDLSQEFARTKKIFLNSTEILSQLKIKRHEFKKSSRNLTPSASIHELAE